jgi:trimeric autotransporter adhesin
MRTILPSSNTQNNTILAATTRIVTSFARKASNKENQKENIGYRTKWNLLHFAVLLLMILGLSNIGLGQTTIYTQNFGTGTSLPTGWSSSGSVSWTNSQNSSSSGYTGASGGSNALHTNSAGTGTLTFSNNLSTVGYINITVLWGANRTGNNTSTFQYSIDGTNWTTVPFTEATNNTTWMLVNGGTRISLPVDASGVSNLRFRWTHTSDNSPTNYIRLDDFSVEGCNMPSQPSPISGSNSVCTGISRNYSVTNVAGVTYTWTFPAGWTQTGGGTTNSVTVTTGSGSGNITVTPSNSCGNGTSRTLAVNVTSPISSVIGKSDITCNAANDGTITVSVTGGTSPYEFSVNEGASWQGPTSGTTISLFTGLFPNTVYKIMVRDANGCLSR